MIYNVWYICATEVLLSTMAQRNLEVQIEVLGVIDEQICQQQADTGLNI